LAVEGVFSNVRLALFFRGTLTTPTVLTGSLKEFGLVEVLQVSGARLNDGRDSA